MPNEYILFFHKCRRRTFCVPGLYWVNPGTVGITTSVAVLETHGLGKEAGGQYIMKHRPSAIGSQKRTASRKVSERI